MRCIAYFSEVVWLNGIVKVVPIGLSRIHRQGLENNFNAGITGVLSYSGGLYLQIIEGESKQVQQLFDRIKADPRHKNITKFLDINTQQRFFPKWPMKLINNLTHVVELREFYRICKKGFQLTPENKEMLLKKFFRDIEIVDDTAVEFSDKLLYLSNWPDFSKITPSSQVIDVCSHLTVGYRRYNQMISSGNFGTPNYVDSLLYQFKQMGILKIREQAIDFDAATHAPVHSGGRFFSKMRSFLGLH